MQPAQVEGIHYDLKDDEKTRMKKMHVNKLIIGNTSEIPKEFIKSEEEIKILLSNPSNFTNTQEEDREFTRIIGAKIRGTFKDDVQLLKSKFMKKGLQTVIEAFWL